MTPRAQVNLDSSTYELFAQYIRTAHKKILQPEIEMTTPSHSPALHSMYMENTKTKANFKRLINTSHFQHTDEIHSNQLTATHLRDNIQITPKSLANAILSISMSELAAKATNDAYYLLTRLSLSPHRIALIEKRPYKACPLCFTELGICEQNNQYHSFYDCLIPKFKRKFLYFTWYQFAGIFIKTDK